MNRMSRKAASAVTAAFMLQVFSPLCTVSAETVLSDEEAEVSFEAKVSEGDSVDIDSVNNIRTILQRPIPLMKYPKRLLNI